mgnify:FL=1
MKKIIFIALFTVLGGLFFAESECEKLMSKIEAKYDVKHLELPDSYLTSFDLNSIKKFAKVDWRGRLVSSDLIEFKQKGKNYKLQVESVGTNCFYEYKTTFKVIDYDNQVVQLLKTESDLLALYLFDCDFDGYEDLLLPFEDDDGNRFYCIYYWSQAQRKFKKDDKKLYAPQFDSKHKKIVEKQTEVKGSFRTETYTFYEFRFGIKRFCGSYKLNFVLNSKKEPVDFNFIFWDSEEAKEKKIGEYIYSLPSWAAFESFSESEKKETRKQYNKMIKMLDIF